MQSAESLAHIMWTVTAKKCSYFCSVFVCLFFLIIIIILGHCFPKMDAIPFGVFPTSNFTLNIPRWIEHTLYVCVCVFSDDQVTDPFFPFPSKPIKFPFCSCRYSIDRHTDLERLFNIDSVNGTITTLKALDREMSKWHNISVVATEISNFIFHQQLLCSKKKKTIILGLQLMLGI